MTKILPIGRQCFTTRKFFVKFCLTFWSVDPVGVRARSARISLFLFTFRFSTLEHQHSNTNTRTPTGTVKRAVISKPDNGDGHILCIEGTDLLAVMNAVGVDHKRTTTNRVIETERVLGIEATRKTIMKEITTTYDAYGVDVTTDT